jgi:DNA-binding HxlR family transcriptional regulator
MNYGKLYEALHFLSHRSTFEILAALQRQDWRYSRLVREVQLREMHHQVPSGNTVSVTLARLVDEGFVRHEEAMYSLTERGRQALPLTAEFVAKLGWWDDDHTDVAEDVGR